MPRKLVHILTYVDSVARTAMCVGCGPVKIYAAGFTKNGRQLYRCVNSHIRKSRNDAGLTPAERDLFLVGRVCEICGTADELIVDHDHVTNKLRGALCKLHNTAFAFFGDGDATTEQWLKAAIRYNRKYHR
jgi:hypothetical protein